MQTSHHTAHVCVFSSEVLILFLKLFILGFPGMLAESKSYSLLATAFSPSVFLCRGKPLSLNSRTSVGHCPAKREAAHTVRIELLQALQLKPSTTISVQAAAACQGELVSCAHR